MLLGYFITHNTIQFYSSYYGYLIGDPQYYLAEGCMRREIQTIYEQTELNMIFEMCDTILSEVSQSKKIQSGPKPFNTHSVNKIRNKSILKSTKKEQASKNKDKRISFREQIMTAGDLLRNEIGNAIFKILRHHIYSIAKIKETPPVYPEEDIKNASFDIYNEFRMMNPKYGRKFIKNATKYKLSSFKKDIKEYYMRIKEDSKTKEFHQKLVELVIKEYDKYSIQDKEVIAKDIEMKLELVSTSNK